MTSFATESQAAAAAADILADLIERTSEWDRAVVEQAVRAVGADGRPFSANDFRDVLPELASGTVGVVIRSMATRRPAALIYVGEVRSTAVSTHGKRIGQYVLAPAARASGQVAA